MTLIDTSAWIDFFRGRDPIAQAVDDALASNDALICGPIEAELRRGLRNERERTEILSLLEACRSLGQPDDLWREAGDLGFKLRRGGVTPKTLALLIAVYALSHSATLLTADRDFVDMRRAGLPLLLLAM